MNLQLTPVVRKPRGWAEVEIVAKVALPRRLCALERAHPVARHYAATLAG